MPGGEIQDKAIGNLGHRSFCATGPCILSQDNLGYESHIKEPCPYVLGAQEPSTDKAMVLASISV